MIITGSVENYPVNLAVIQQGYCCAKMHLSKGQWIYDATEQRSMEL